MNFKVEQTDNRGVLTLGGELTIDRAEELRTILIRLLESTDHLLVSLEEVTEVDLSFLQLLCSAHWTSMKSLKRLELVGHCQEVFQSVAESAGYSRHIGCHLNHEKGCLWVGKEEEDEQNHHDG